MVSRLEVDLIDSLVCAGGVYGDVECLGHFECGMSGHLAELFEAYAAGVGHVCDEGFSKCVGGYGTFFSEDGYACAFGGALEPLPEFPVEETVVLKPGEDVFFSGRKVFNDVGEDFGCAFGQWYGALFAGFGWSVGFVADMDEAAFEVDIGFRKVSGFSAAYAREVDGFKDFPVFGICGGEDEFEFFAGDGEWFFLVYTGKAVVVFEGVFDEVIPGHGPVEDDYEHADLVDEGGGADFVVLEAPDAVAVHHSVVEFGGEEVVYVVLVEESFHPEDPFGVALERTFGDGIFYGGKIFLYEAHEGYVGRGAFHYCPEVFGYVVGDLIEDDVVDGFVSAEVVFGYKDVAEDAFGPDAVGLLGGFAVFDGSDLICDVVVWGFRVCTSEESLHGLSIPSGTLPAHQLFCRGALYDVCSCVSRGYLMVFFCVAPNSILFTKHFLEVIWLEQVSACFGSFEYGVLRWVMGAGGEGFGTLLTHQGFQWVGSTSRARGVKDGWFTD